MFILYVSILQNIEIFPFVIIVHHIIFLYTNVLILIFYTKYIHFLDFDRIDLILPHYVFRVSFFIFHLLYVEFMFFLLIKMNAFYDLISTLIK